nr:hypothetical protein [Sphingobium sp. SJ10-10]
DSTGRQRCISIYGVVILTQPDNHLCTTPLSFLVAKTAKPNHVATASIKKPIHNVKERTAQRASS